MKSLFINTKWWYDKANGNAYFSSRIYADGECIGVNPFQYGNPDSQPDQETLKFLLTNGYLNYSDRDEYRALWHINNHRSPSEKIAIYRATERTTKKAVKEWAEVSL